MTFEIFELQMFFKQRMTSQNGIELRMVSGASSGMPLAFLKAAPTRTGVGKYCNAWSSLQRCKTVTVGSAWPGIKSMPFFPVITLPWFSNRLRTKRPRQVRGGRIPCPIQGHYRSSLLVWGCCLNVLFLPAFPNASNPDEHQNLFVGPTFHRV